MPPADLASSKVPRLLLAALLLSFPASAALRAGAHATDVTPARFPVIVNCMFLERTADTAHTPIYARSLVLDDGPVRLAIVVVDSCMMPRELIDQAKQLAHARTGIPAERMLVSATHTHSAPAAMGCLGSDVDPEYARFLPEKIAESIEAAARKLAPVRAGWAVVDDFQHTHTRRWIFRPDRMRMDPFGSLTVRANMHPGYENPDAISPSGPVDPGLSVLALQSPSGRPVALLANYSMHYFGSPFVSADYFGLFVEKIARRIGVAEGDPPFVAMMSQGTSGDQMWMDYGKPKSDLTLDAYAEGVTAVAYDAWRKIQYRDTAPLAMAEAKLTLRRRIPDAQRLAWAKELLAKMNGRKPATQPEVYAREQVILHQEPVRELKLQALRIGELGITAIPNEVFAITGLKIKAQSPLQPVFNIELANGAEGYIPPPEQHKLGGYTTWPARSAGLQVEAEPRIVDTVLSLLEKVSGRTRRPVDDSHGPYALAVLDSKPLAYWRLTEMRGPRALDAAGRNHGHYEDGIAFYLPGPDSPAFSGGAINRSAHFAGGRLRARIPGLGANWSLEMWFWNGLPPDARNVTGYLFSRGSDRLAIGGTAGASGRLVLNDSPGGLAGPTSLPLKTWHHVVFVREGSALRVYLNGNETPEISGQAASVSGDEISIGGAVDGTFSFEGKIDEVAVYGRALSPSESARRRALSGMPRPSARALRPDVPLAE